MRCVNEIFPPRVRLRWLLMTMRLSAISLAGTARTLVAVGTLSEASMFFAMAAAAPRRTLVSGSDFACFSALSAFSALAAWPDRPELAPFSAGCGAGLGVGFAGAACWACCGSAFLGSACFGSACAGCSAGAVEGAAAALADPWPLAEGAASVVSGFRSCVGEKSAKNSCHAASTEEGSARNWSYISSTSHSLGPNCDAGLLLDTAGTRLYLSRCANYARPRLTPRLVAPVTELELRARFVRQEARDFSLNRYRPQGVRPLTPRRVRKVAVGAVLREVSHAGTTRWHQRLTATCGTGLRRMGPSSRSAPSAGAAGDRPSRMRLCRVG